MTIELGPVPAPTENGLPLRGVSAPVFGSTAYAEISFETLLVTYAKLPLGSMLMDVGAVPARKGAPPLVSTSKPLMASML